MSSGQKMCVLRCFSKMYSSSFSLDRPAFYHHSVRVRAITRLTRRTKAVWTGESYHVALPLRKSVGELVEKSCRRLGSGDIETRRILDRFSRTTGDPQDQRAAQCNR